jgi:hypothetical protein
VSGRAAQDHPPLRLLFGSEVFVRQPEAGLARSELGTRLALPTAGITRILTADYSGAADEGRVADGVEVSVLFSGVEERAGGTPSDRRAPRGEVSTP